MQNLLGVPGDSASMESRMGAASYRYVAVCILSILAGSMSATSASALVSPVGESSGTAACVTTVPNHSVVNPETGKILLQNGTVIEISSIPCSPGLEASVYANVGYGYMSVSSPEYFTYIQDSWSVPSAPSSGGFNDTQADVFWNGFQGTSTQDIVQPILVYGCITYDALTQTCTEGSSSAWSIFDQANVGNHWYSSSAISVSATDSIVGAVTYDSSLTFCNSSGPGYSIGIGDSTSSQSVNYSICDTFQFREAIGQSLEVHYLTACNQMPNATSEDFSSLSWYTSTGTTPSYGTGSDLSFCSAGASWNYGDGGVTTAWTT